MMDGLVYAALILALVGHSSGTWCVCKEGLSDAVLQKTLDYACGAGGDCTLIHQNGGCYNPNTVRAHCNYAVNSYFQKKGQAQGSCDFSGTASVTSSDPSTTGCVYPASTSSTSTGTTTPVTTTPSSSTTTPSTTPSTTTPSIGTTPSTTTTPSTSTNPISGSPYLTTPTGVLGPSGTTGINTDVSHGGFMLQQTSCCWFSFSVILIMLSAAFVFVWN